MKSAKKTPEPILTFTRATEWHAWLAEHHHEPQAVLLRIGKNGAKSITYAQAIEAALAWGWIDSRKQSLDDSAWLQRFSQRTAKSPWSKINCQKAESLIAAGAMQPPGLAEVECAKRDGRWERAYHGARAATVPPDLEAAFARNKKARAFFEALDGANRYAILYRVQTAKKPETRAERITRFVAMCADGETIHPPRKASAKAATKK